jgi:hypothetical protein
MGNLNLNASLTNLMAEEGVLTIKGNPQNASVVPLVLQDNGDTANGVCTTLADCTTSTLAAGSQPVTMVETEASSGTFTSYDESDVSQLKPEGAGSRRGDRVQTRSRATVRGMCRDPDLEARRG